MTPTSTTVLIVEDQPGDRRLYREYLSDDDWCAYQVLEASNGETGLQLYAENRPDCIILDYNLPGMNGLEFLDRLEAAHGKIPCPVIVLTGYREHKISAEALKRGAQDALIKDFISPSHLPRYVRHAIEKFALAQEKDLARRALIRTQQSLNFAQSVAELGSWEFDTSSGRFSVSDNQLRLMGFDPESETVSWRRWLDRLHPDDRQSIEADVAELMAGSVPPDKEFRVVWPNAQIRWLIARAREIAGDGGSRRIIGVTVDITEQKRAQEALKESEARYRLLFDGNPQPMWVYDEETQYFLDVNAAAVDMLRYSREDLLSISLLDLEAQDEMGRPRLRFEQRPAGNRGIPQLQLRRKDGTVLFVESRCHTVEFRGKRASLALISDVTEREQLEEQLRQAQKMEAVGRLAGGIAHDFNNLLTVIAGYTDLLLRRLPADGPLRAKAEAIQKATELATGLTGQLLAFSRKQVRKPVRVNLNDAVGRMTAVLTRLLGDDIEMATDFHADLQPVLIDPTQLEQVVMNLSVNARDAMPQGGTLRISTANSLEKEHVVLTVKDSGIGMDQETLERIFEPFFTTKPAGKGTGMGLATVYGIINQSGGYVEVESEPLAGSIFRIVLPRASEEAIQPREVAPVATREWGRGNVLLVEDSQSVRALVREILHGSGYTVVEARDGSEALALFVQHERQFQLVISDIVMPRMSGPALADELRRLQPDVKILFMSAYADDTLIHEGKLQSGVAFLQKPFTPAALLAKSREVLKGG